MNLPPPDPGWIGYIGHMESARPEIIRCPPHLVAEAISLVLADIAPSQRREIARRLLETDDPDELGSEPLFVALRDGRLRAAAWGQRQTGNTAVFWPPQRVAGESDETAFELARAVVQRLDQTAVEMTQTLLAPSDGAAVSVLEDVGFDRLAELLYMSCEADRFPATEPNLDHFEFEPYRAAKRGRFTAIIERTYDQTLDCIGLNGKRSIEEVINGYQGTGVFRAENWRLVRRDGRDVGVLLLAEHPQAQHWELIYMGLAPEARGQGWGRLITENAKWLAHRAGIERIVLAVDAANLPALRMYRAAGFEMWDRRIVFVRFPP